MSFFYVKVKQCIYNIYVKKIMDSKRFWKTIRPKFSNICKTANINVIVENDNILQEEKVTLLNYFTDLTDILGLKNTKIGLEKSFSQFVENFRNSESMKKIKEFLQEATKDSSISFKAIIVEEIQTAIKDLPINKSTYLVKFQQKFISNMLR